MAKLSTTIMEQEVVTLLSSFDSGQKIDARDESYIP